MAHSVFSIVAFLCYFVCLTYLADGLDLGAVEGQKKGYQNSTISSSGSFNALASDTLFNNTDVHVDGVPQSINKYLAMIKTERYKLYYGVKAALNVYGMFGVYGTPWVNSDLYSESKIYIGNEDTGEVVQAGWHVYQNIYGDYHTRFFVHWTADGFKNTGCFNLLCKGFVRDTSCRLAPGDIVRPLSKYNGDQFEMRLKIMKNLETENWELFYGPNWDIRVGYWPESLFKTFDFANRIDIGGKVMHPELRPSPPMGSGHFAAEGFKRAAFIRDIQFSVIPDSWYTPDFDEVSYILNKARCYTIAGSPKQYIYFGGPGNCLNYNTSPVNSMHDTSLS